MFTIVEVVSVGGHGIGDVCDASHVPPLGCGVGIEACCLHLDGVHADCAGGGGGLRTERLIRALPLPPRTGHG
jgi:hypothetical protein